VTRITPIHLDVGNCHVSISLYDSFYGHVETKSSKSPLSPFPVITHADPAILPASRLPPRSNHRHSGPRAAAGYCPQPRCGGGKNPGSQLWDRRVREQYFLTYSLPSWAIRC
jgi:hypothetical protein